MTTIAHPSLEAELRREPTAFRVLNGDRPTGPLHVGHYFGTLENRVRRQRLGVEPDELLVSTPDAERTRRSSTRGARVRDAERRRRPAAPGTAADRADGGRPPPHRVGHR